MNESNMDINQIILIIIVVLLSIIVLLGIYFLITYIMKKKQGKKENSLFDPTKLHEENSLVKVMDEKKNVEFKNNKDQFINNQEEVKIVTSEVMEQEQKINPFGVDLTKRTKDNTPINDYGDSYNNNNKFIK